MTRERVLFLCTHNSARSQMAEAFLRALAGDRFEAESAGTEATGVNPLAIRAMREVGVDLAGHRSKTLDRFLDEPWDHVITVCDSANERCPIFPRSVRRLHWSFDDPSRAIGSDDERLRVFRRIRDEISARIRGWLAERDRALRVPAASFAGGTGADNRASARDQRERRATTVRARAAIPADAGAIARIYNEGIEDRIATFETRPRSAEDIASWFDGVHPVVVVEEAADQVVGFASCSSYRPRACYAKVAEFSVYVARGHRGGGVGRVALEGLVAACREAGLHKLVSRIFPENAASRAMCRAVGFREVGVYQEHGQLGDTWKDCVIVERIVAG
jgi:phosphinothricin acetyltransferase